MTIQEMMEQVVRQARQQAGQPDPDFNYLEMVFLPRKGIWIWKGEQTEDITDQSLINS